jgi:hypothetical protein
MVWWLQRRPLFEVGEEQVAQEIKLLNPVSPQPTVAPAAAPAQPTALALEWRAFESPAPQRARRYLQAGNHYVEEAQDYGSALRCYEQALAGGGTQLQQITPEDSWLVMVLKLDHKRREN